MNAIELFHGDGRSAGVYFCETCKIIWREKDLAGRCCLPKTCSNCGGAIRRPYYTICDECEAVKMSKVESERFTKAEKLTEWDGWVYSDGLGWRDGYFEDVGELVGHCHDEETEVPEYAWACKKVQFAHVDLDRVLEWISESGWEDFSRDDLNGVDELKAAIDRFNEANKDVVVWEVDYNRAVLIAKED